MAQNLANVFFFFSFSSLFSSSFHHKLSMLRLSVFVVCALIFSFFSPPAAYIFFCSDTASRTPTFIYYICNIACRSRPRFLVFSTYRIAFFCCLHFCCCRCRCRPPPSLRLNVVHTSIHISCELCRSRSEEQLKWIMKLVNFHQYPWGTAGRRGGAASVRLCCFQFIFFFRFSRFFVVVFYSVIRWPNVSIREYETEEAF